MSEQIILGAESTRAAELDWAVLLIVYVEPANNFNGTDKVIAVVKVMTWLLSS